MTVINQNSISGITSITAASGSVQIFNSDGSSGSLTDLAGINVAGVVTATSYSGTSDTIKFETGGSERARINSSGNFGVGTASPSNKLTIGEAGGAVVRLSDNTDGGFALIRSDSAGGLNFSADHGATRADTTITFGVDGNTEAARIDSSGRLLVGTTADTSGGSTTTSVQIVGNADNKNGELYLCRNDSTVSSSNPIGTIQFRSNHGGTYEPHAQIQVQADGTIGSGDKPGRILFSTCSDGTATLTERLRITSAGYVRLQTSGVGIQFNGDTAAANALDDYEEGTWSPQLVGTTGSAGSWAQDITEGRYVKIGQMVYLTGYCRLTNKGSYGGNTIVQGLPFTVKNDPDSYGCGSCFTQNFTGTANAVIEWYPNINQTTATVFYKATSNGTSASLAYTYVSNTSQFGAFSMFYPTDS